MVKTVRAFDVLDGGGGEERAARKSAHVTLVTAVDGANFQIEIR